MAIRIVDEPDTYLTAGEHARLQREWQKACAYTVNPPTFEDFVRRRKSSQELDKAWNDAVERGDADRKARVSNPDGKVRAGELERSE